MGSKRWLIKSADLNSVGNELKLACPSWGSDLDPDGSVYSVRKWGSGRMNRRAYCGKELVCTAAVSAIPTTTMTITRQKTAERIKRVG